MNAEKRFSVRDVIKSAWHSVKGTKWAIWGPFLVLCLMSVGVYLLLALVVMAFTTAIGDFPPKMPFDPDAFQGLFPYMMVAVNVIQAIVLFATAPLVAGVQMVALKRARGEMMTASAGFQYWHKWIPLGFGLVFFAIGLAVINLVMHALAPVAVVGVIAALLGSVALALFYLFFLFIPLCIADKNVGPLAAFGCSAKLVAQHWFRVLLTILVTVLISLIVALPAILGALCPLWEIKVLGGIGTFVLFIWYLPFGYLVLSTMYQRLESKARGSE